MIDHIKTSFQDVCSALLDHDKLFPAKLLPSFSDLGSDEIARLQAVWPEIIEERKVSLLSDLENLAEADTLTNFDSLSRFALSDPSGDVRVLAIRLLWECDDRDLIDRFIQMMKTDPDVQVRAAAASALGSFVYEGELEELPARILDRIVDELVDTYQTTTKNLVKRHALESLGFSSRDGVEGFIREMYRSTKVEEIASALFAMGRSADTRYDKNVVVHLHNPSTLIQLEAVRASGELDIKSVRGDLLEMLDDSHLDEEVQYALIWALSQLGGPGVKDKFEEIMDSEIDDDLADFLENAMDNLAFNDGLADFDLLELDTDKE